MASSLVPYSHDPYNTGGGGYGGYGGAGQYGAAYGHHGAYGAYGAYYGYGYGHGQYGQQSHGHGHHQQPLTHTHTHGYAPDAGYGYHESYSRAGASAYQYSPYNAGYAGGYSRGGAAGSVYGGYATAATAGYGQPATYSRAAAQPATVTNPAYGGPGTVHNAGYATGSAYAPHGYGARPAAAPQAPGAPQSRRRLFFTSSAGRSLPRGPSPGEDSFFISNSGLALGIADGVGSWKTHGIDAGQYSRGLMAHANAYVTDAVLNGRTDQLNPLAVLTYAFLANQQNNVIGTSTALVAMVDSDSVLRLLNVGDSVCLVFRNAQLVYRTQEQQHSFNCPFQLGTNSLDRPNQGEHHTFHVQEGDIIALASDGVTDNIFDQDIARAVASSHDTAQIATAIVTAAKHASTHRTAPTPFAASASRNGVPYQGGKADDITVVVSRISANQAAAGSRQG